MRRPPGLPSQAVQPMPSPFLGGRVKDKASFQQIPGSLVSMGGWRARAGAVGGARAEKWPGQGHRTFCTAGLWVRRRAAGGAVLAGQEVELWAFDPVRTALRVPYPQALSGLRCLPSLRPSCASSNSLEGGLGSQRPSLTVANASSDTPGSGHKQLGEAAGRRLV